MILSYRVHGVAVYLDNWAIEELSKDRSKDLSDQFFHALSRSDGSLLISLVNFLELGIRQGKSISRIQEFLNRFGSRWVPVGLNPWEAMRHERNFSTADSGSACFSAKTLEAFCKERQPMHPTDPSFFRLGAVMDFLGGRRHEIASMCSKLDDEFASFLNCLKDAHRRCNSGLDQYLQGISWDPALPLTFVCTNLVRDLVRKGTVLKKNDGRDFCHAVMAAAYGSLAALDRKWKNRIEALPKPNQLARIYYKPELEKLIKDLEAVSANEHSAALRSPGF